MAKIIQITKDDINGLMASVVTKSLIQGIDEVESINGTNEMCEELVKSIIKSADQSCFGNGVYEEYSFYVPYTGKTVHVDSSTEVIAILDVALSQSITSKIINYNKKVQDSSLPYIYICNSWVNNLYLPTYVSKNDGSEYTTTAEKWLKFIIAKYSPTLSKGFLKCLMEASAISPAYKLKQNNDKKNNGRLIKTLLICLSFYGFDAYSDILVAKYKGTEKTAPSKNESYVSHNFGKHVIENMAISIIANTELTDNGFMAFININHFDIWALSDALKMANDKFKNSKHLSVPTENMDIPTTDIFESDHIYAVVAIDQYITQDVHIRRAKDVNGRMVEIAYKIGKSEVVQSYNSKFSTMAKDEIKNLFLISELYESIPAEAIDTSISA